MYEVFLEKRAERDLKKLPGKVFDRIVQQIKKLAENPRPKRAR